MPDWNPALYLRFEQERTRPARELLARVALPAPRRVVDLGCGPGNSTALLVQRFPSAHVLGLDDSVAMIEQARERVPQASYRCQDIAAWAADAPGPDGEAPDLIYSNAALQWVGEHDSLLARLFARLAPGGVLAVQMPDNLNEPTHRLMREVARLPRFAALAPEVARAPLLAVEAYYDLFAQAAAAAIDVWHTVYRHVMPTAQAIVDWLRATGLRPFLDALPQALKPEFLAEYERRIADAYAERADGCRLMAFPRLFFVVQRQP